MNVELEQRFGKFCQTVLTLYENERVEPNEDNVLKYNKYVWHWNRQNIRDAFADR
jgi:hypothetical protein